MPHLYDREHLNRSSYMNNDDLHQKYTEMNHHGNDVLHQNYNYIVNEESQSGMAHAGLNQVQAQQGTYSVDLFQSDIEFNPQNHIQQPDTSIHQYPPHHVIMQNLLFYLMIVIDRTSIQLFTMKRMSK